MFPEEVTARRCVSRGEASLRNSLRAGGQSPSTRYTGVGRGPTGDSTGTIQEARGIYPQSPGMGNLEPDSCLGSAAANRGPLRVWKVARQHREARGAPRGLGREGQTTQNKATGAGAKGAAEEGPRALAWGTETPVKQEPSPLLLRSWVQSSQQLLGGAQRVPPSPAQAP